MAIKKTTKKRQTRKNPRESLVSKKLPRHITAFSYGSNALAIEVLVEALYSLGRLEKVDSARVEIARLLAKAVDENPENANLWRQYREAEDVLRTVGADDVKDFNETLASIWGDAALRDKPESST